MDREATSVVCQTWPIDGGLIVFEVRTDRPLPASAFTPIGEAVASLDCLAMTLAPHTPDGGTGAQDDDD